MLKGNYLFPDVDALFAHDPEIAREMLRVSRALENAGSRGDLLAESQGEAIMGHRMSLQDEANTHVKLAQKWNELLTKIRTIPKFEDFLRPTSCSSLLKNLPDSGPVAVINVHKDSCDALVLLSDLDEPLHIPLQKFSYAKATDLRNKLNAHLSAANVRMRDCEFDAFRATRPTRDNDGGGVIKYILHQLWILVVKPILDGLGFLVCYSWFFSHVKTIFIFNVPKGTTSIQIATYLVVCNRTSCISSDTCSWNICHIYIKGWTHSIRFRHLILHTQRDSAE